METPPSDVVSIFNQFYYSPSTEQLWLYGGAMGVSAWTQVARAEVIQAALDAVTTYVDSGLASKEDKSNKTSSITGISESKYPTEGAVQNKFYGGNIIDNKVIISSDVDKLFDMSPMSYNLFHDVLAFNKKIGLNLTYEITVDGVNWVESAIPRRLFWQKASETAVTLTNTVDMQKGLRLQFQGLASARANWLNLQCLSTTTHAYLDVTVEQSSDGITWTTTHQSIAQRTNQYNSNKYYIKYVNTDIFRVTIKINEGASVNGAVSRIAGIQLLSFRNGGQAGSKELEYPYDWDQAGVLIRKQPARSLDDLNISGAWTPGKYFIAGVDKDGKDMRLDPKEGVFGTFGADGNLLSVIKDTLPAPLWFTPDNMISLREINREATPINPDTRQNIHIALNTSLGVGSSYGFDARQAGGNDRVIPEVINGKSAIKFTLTRRQPVRPERSEIYEAPSYTNIPFTSSNRIRYYGTAIFVPVGTRTDFGETAPVVFQFHDADSTAKPSRPPIQALLIKNNHWVYEITADIRDIPEADYRLRKSYDLGPVNLGMFTTWELETKFSGAEADGYIILRKNGATVLNLHDIATAYNDPAGQMPYLKQGIYNYMWGYMGDEEESITDEIIIYHAETRYGFIDCSLDDVKVDDTYLSNNEALNMNVDADFVNTQTLDVSGQAKFSGYGAGIAKLDSDGLLSTLPLGTPSQVLRLSSGGVLGFHSNGALTPADGTLTFSGSYNALSPVTVKINLSNANTWVGQQSGTTPTAGDNSTKFATTAFVQAALADFVINPTTSSLDAVTLNATYPSVPLGYRVICGNIVGGGEIYTKYGATNWLKTLAQVQP